MGRFIAVYQISVQDCQVFVLVKCALLCRMSHLDPGLAFGFSVGQIVLDWAHGDKILYSVLLCQLCCSDKEIIFASNQRCVVVSHVYNLVCAFKSNVECLTVCCYSLVNNYALLVKFSLEGVNMLMIRFKIKQPDSVVLPIFH